jgi:hypothetical protein
MGWGEREGTRSKNEGKEIQRGNERVPNKKKRERKRYLVIESKKSAHTSRKISGETIDLGVFVFVD